MTRAAFHALATLLLAACNGREAFPRDSASHQPVDQMRPAAITVSTERHPAAAPSYRGQRQEQSAFDITYAVARPPDKALRIDAGRLLIRTGEITLRVDTLDRAVRRARDVAEAVGAIITASNAQSGDVEHRSTAIELRVPADQFDRTIEGLRRIGLVETVHVATEDVGEEYVDVGARIANGRRLEARLLALLSSRTGKLSDVVAVEGELARVRTEIDGFEGRRRYLQQHVSLSTITVNMHEPVTVVGVPSPGVLRAAFAQSWENLVWFIALLIRSAGVVLPLGVMVMAAWILMRKEGKVGATSGFIKLGRHDTTMAS